jgi:hypothetical protein
MGETECRGGRSEIKGHRERLDRINRIVRIMVFCYGETEHHVNQINPV